MSFLQNDHNTLFYRYLPVPGAENIVFINSLGTSQAIWSGVEEALQGRFGLLFFDKRGHGLSSVNPGPVTIDDMANDIIDLLDHLDIQKAHIVGLSIGGLITLSLASRYPDRVGRLVMSNTGAKLGSEESWNTRIAGIREDGMEGHAEAIVERWLSPVFMKANPAIASGMVTMLKRSSSQGYIQACEAIRDADYRPVMGSISHPVRFIGGSADPGTTADFVRKQASKMDAEAVILEGVGHLPCIEQPGRMAGILTDFFESGETDLYAKGMQTRRSVLGDAHVDRAEANKTSFDADFQEYIVNSAWGSIWSRPGLTKRERSLITLSLLAALGHDEELAMHIRACENTGASAEDIKEALLHTGIYAGVPVTNHAMKIAKQILTKNKKQDG